MSDAVDTACRHHCEPARCTGALVSGPMSVLPMLVDSLRQMGMIQHAHGTAALAAGAEAAPAVDHSLRMSTHQARAGIAKHTRL